MPRKKLVKTPEVSTSAPTTTAPIPVAPETATSTQPFYVEYMHLGKGRHVIRQFNSLEEAKAFIAATLPWMEAGKVTNARLVVEPGNLEVV